MNGMNNMKMTTTTASAAATSSSSSMGGMDMTMGPGSCKISMLWNWDTIGACFLSEGWQITSTGMFAGSCIGVVFLVVSLEFLRRISREYERFIRRPRRVGSVQSYGSFESGSDTPVVNKTATVAARENGRTVAALNPAPRKLRLSRMVTQQVVRAALHMVQFGVAYFIMLLAMYYNGYFIISILVGAFIGSFIFSWDQMGTTNDACEITYCCG